MKRINRNTMAAAMDGIKELDLDPVSRTLSSAMLAAAVRDVAGLQRWWAHKIRVLRATLNETEAVADELDRDGAPIAGRVVDAALRQAAAILDDALAAFVKAVPIPDGQGAFAEA